MVIDPEIGIKGISGFKRRDLDDHYNTNLLGFPQ